MGRILVVDDSSTVRLKLTKAVRTLGHEVFAVADGLAALKAVNEQDYDTVLLDIMMPGMDGFEVLEAVKSEPRTKDIPVIVISALSDTMTSVVKAMELGAEDFLPKNFELDLLKSRLTASVEKSLKRMAAPQISVRAAAPDDIPILLSLINTAGAGLPLEIWRSTAAEGQSAWDKGRADMLDDALDVHYGNCWIAETPVGGLGAMVLYVPPRQSNPGNAGAASFMGPLEELECAAHGTAHVAYLCTVDSARGQGIGSALLRFAESRRTEQGLTLVVASSNYGARALYQRHGYSETMRRPMILANGHVNGHDWILMRKA
ncbi:GNAT family N-acetyltransferase [Paragemmobacter straminiformis]|uniref:GNAT family N-acetyltransferase n=1 Tax=Paragemmobacter straminiformis TaxID=2045119 RepID=A0A842I663_9RHOB|nr:GNAT family N-acetyltransferase [Gemmobacter straminiformis]MBC2834554.1 GNAT family N-acetyltransferase [Gemmobacter straminiformis]